MDAPTTTSADYGTSGENDKGGWFTPRRQPDQGRTGSGDAPEGTGRERSAVPKRPVASIRPVGSGASRTAPPPSVTESEAPPADRVAAADDDPPHRAPLPEARHDQDPQHDTAQGSHPRHNAAQGGHPQQQATQSQIPQHEAGHPRETPMRLHLAGHSHEGQGAEAPAAPQDHAHEAHAAHRAQSREAPSYDDPFAEHRPPAAPADNASPDAILIRRTMAEVAPVADKVTSYFYALLFVRHPELRGLFPAAMDSQRDRLLKALLTAAEHMDNAEVLTEYLQHLGRGHRKYGTQAAHYPAVGEALIGALSRYATSTWDEETEAAWVRTYTTISQIMIDAAAQNERLAPAWWHAEVVSHDLRTPDIAIITVRPDQPYAFVAGQYTSLETPWWPRIWRHYSFAGAPRSDGLLTFHVKAVPAGWVSNALVHHARPGDVLRLGPPAGSMTVDHTTDNGLLCLGGGTGIAPIKALVEDVAEHGTRRLVEVFYGARTNFDLYDIDTMLRLQQTHPWLSVRPVVDDRAHFPDAVREFGPWYEYSAYLSGPPGMIRSGVHALRGIGIPVDRIRHDSLEELVAAGD
ncbi:globin domain-containing protein [Streptomyces sp. NBC_00306]|uniref:globin domain-containing protein n=1 Tax=Streptomyces sp. NBC_00306 TaxID=2975708 RepID=UPI002E28116D|nr:globin domain-containing protein [Streptomyces sp. NBC_00306]